MYLLDFLSALYANLTVPSILLYGLTFLVASIVSCASGLFVIHGRFRIRNTWKAAWRFMPSSAAVGGLVLLALLPWPVLPMGGGLETQIIQSYCSRFEWALTQSLDAEAQRGGKPFLIYENGGGIVMTAEEKNRYFPLVCKHAGKILPGIILDKPRDLLPPDGRIEYQNVLVRRIIAWNKNTVEKAMQESVRKAGCIYRWIVGSFAFVFLVILLLRADRYGRLQAELVTSREDD